MIFNMHRPFQIITDALAHPASMCITVALSGYWVYSKPETWYDSLLAGGAMLLAQGIYKSGRPRDEAMHKKLDEIIHGTDADDAVAGSEID
jgi:hypothetical protein